MPAEAEIYPGMEDIAGLCADKSAPYLRAGNVGVEVNAPYENVSEVSIEVDPLISNADGAAYFMFMPMEDTLNEQGENHLGWDSDVERDFLDEMQAEAQGLYDDAKVVGHDDARKAKDLASEAKILLKEIEDSYDLWHTDYYYAAADDGVVWAPLSREWSEFKDQLDPDEHHTYMPGVIGYVQQARLDQRQEIRELWDHALSLLWCGEISLAKAESWLANKDLYFQYEQDRESTFQLDPQGTDASAPIRSTIRGGRLSSAQAQTQTSTLRTDAGGTTRGQIQPATAAGMGMILLVPVALTFYFLSRRK